MSVGRKQEIVIRVDRLSWGDNGWHGVIALSEWVKSSGKRVGASLRALAATAAAP
jgi:hypothetical protein